MVGSGFKRENGATTEVVNLISNFDGTLRRPEVFGNAVIVQMIYSHNDEVTGDPQYKRIVSLMLQDESMKSTLTAEAHRILNER